MNNNPEKLSKIIKEYQAGETKSAFLKLQKYSQIYPLDHIATYNLAVMAEREGNVSLAIKSYKKVINNEASHWQSRNNLYLIYFNQKKFSESISLVNEVLAIKPNYQPALRDKAHIMYYEKKYEEAMQLILSSIKINPIDYIAINILGMIYVKMKDFSKAKEVYLKAIKLNNQYYPSYNNLANLFLITDEIEESIPYLSKCLEIKPDFKEALNNLANYHSINGNYKTAIEIYLNILKKEDDDADVHLNLGIAYFRTENFIKAKECLECAERLGLKSDNLFKNIALLNLYNQNYKKGWELYDARLKVDTFFNSNSFFNNIKGKLWDGNEIKKDENILIIKEQGVGDEILYSTMYPDLLSKFKNVKIETEPRLINIFKDCYKNENVFVPYLSISNDLNKLEKIDTVIMSGSLGRLFRNSIESFPKKNLLYVSELRVKSIKNEINKVSKNKIRIGIAWSSKRKFYGKSKSIDLESLIPILTLEGIDFINLQHGDVSEEIRKIHDKYSVKVITIPGLDLFDDFEGQIALLKNLDLLVTISSTMPHLSGACNVPTLLIKPKNNAMFFYWNQKSNLTPWYPSIKLIPQNEKRDLTIDVLKNEILKKLKKYN